MSVALVAVLAPLVAALSIASLRRAAPWLALLGALASAAAAWSTLRATSAGASFSASVEWLPAVRLRMDVDPLAALLSATVASVGLLVLVYAVGYMASDRGTVRFYALMSLFLAAMQSLVMAGDWLLFLASWELIALASYLLIGHEFERDEVGAAAGRAFLTTRAADVGLYLGVFVLFHETGTTAIGATVASGGAVGTLAGLLLLVAAAGKAAQVPFQGWLAAAMVGPTPVSALLHSATLVAAGVILVVRVFPLLPSGVLLVVGVLGGATAVVAGLTAIAQRDLKRLLAASTSSQLGLMLVGLGAGSLAAGVFHLVVHAAMKSALFLGAGVFQHERRSTEFRRLRGAGKEARWAFAAIAVAGLALAGVPPLAGFWSKDTVLAAAFESRAAWLLAPLALIGSLLTAVYVARALRLVWTGDEGATKRVAVPERRGRSGPRAASVWMGVGLGGLAAAAAALGAFVVPIESILGHLPELATAAVLGVVVAAVGLAAGWRWPADTLLGRLRPWAESGFQVAAGLATFTTQPAFALAQAIDALDGVVHRAVVAGAASVLAVARRVSSADRVLHQFVEATAAAVLAMARVARSGDELGIDAMIAALVRRTLAWGRASRTVQSGLVHQELVWAVGGTAALLALLSFVGFAPG